MIVLHCADAGRGDPTMQAMVAPATMLAKNMFCDGRTDDLAL